MSIVMEPIGCAKTNQVQLGSDLREREVCCIHNRRMEGRSTAENNKLIIIILNTNRPP